jgi:hypothetical protein
MRRTLTIILTLLFAFQVLAQEKEKKRLPSEEINVVKPFSPTVSKAVKIPMEPQTDSIDLGLKKEIQYSINSIPVASTFTPAKGKAKTLARVPKERFYQNFISAGYGNYSTSIIEAFVHSSTSNYNDFGGFFKLHSSGGGIDGVELDDSFTRAGIELFYKQSERYFEWKAEAGFNHLSSNWYGLPDDIAFLEPVISSIDEGQAYNDISLGGDIEFFDALVHSGNFDFHHFFDKADSGESSVDISGIIDFPIREELIYTELSLSFLNGKFKNDYLQTGELKYTYFNLGLSPNFELLRDDLTLNIGARLYYSISDAADGSKFYAYPNITASYNILQESFIAYAGVVGDLQQNSYRDFVAKNPFVSPSLYIERTNQQFNAYAGIKGLLNSKIRFNLRAGYMSEGDKPLFKLNPSLTDGTVEVQEGYQAANSFQVVYDDVNTIHFHGELIFDLFKEFQFGGNVHFNSYSLGQEEHSWNLPLVTAALLAQYKRDRWSAGADLFFSSDRKDELAIIPSTTQRITNSAYLDLNVNGLYKINDKIDVFLNVNNILNQNYQEYSNFRVQGFQLFAGIKYKFDL